MSLGFESPWLTGFPIFEVGCVIFLVNMGRGLIVLSCGPHVVLGVVWLVRPCLGESFECYLMGWGEAVELSRDLALSIRRSGYRPDLVVAVGRGGFVPARIVCDYLLMVDLTSVRLEHWGIAATLGERAEVRFPLCVDVHNMNLLVVDDITDTGDTLRTTVEYLARKEPLEVRTAVLQHKSTSRFTPNFYSEYLERWRWIIYPWAAHEDLLGFTQRLLGEGPLTRDQIIEGLREHWSLDPTPRQVEDVLLDLELRGQAQRAGDARIMWVS